MKDTFANFLARTAMYRSEIVDDPILINLKTNKKNTAIHVDILPVGQFHWVDRIEIKGINKKDSLFYSRNCIFRLIMADKIFANLSLQLFHWNSRTQSYIYDLSVPMIIAPMSSYRVDMNGTNGNIIIILHGQRGRPAQ